MLRFIIISIALVLFSKNLLASKHLKLAWLEWPPLGGSSIKHNGIIPDIVRTIFYDAGYTIEISFYPWMRHLHMVETQKADISLGVWESDNLRDRFEFLQNIAIDPGAFVVLKSSKITNGKLSSFSGKTVGLIAGGGYPDALTKDKTIFKEQSSNIENLLAMLEKKRIDAIYNQPHTINWLIDTKLTSLKDKVKVLDPPLVINLLSPAISKNHPNKEKLKADFKKSFDKLVKDGLYEKMYKKFKIRLKPKI